MTPAAEVLARIRAGWTLDELIDSADPAALALSWADLQAIRDELVIERDQAHGAAGHN